MAIHFIGVKRQFKRSDVFRVKADDAFEAFDKVKARYPQSNDNYLNHLYSTDCGLKAHDFEQAISGPETNLINMESDNA